MTMGPYGVHWERTQTWWDLAPAYHQYLARCQYLLRRGLPVADICYLLPEGAPQVFRPPASATRGDPPDRRGYNFDGCAPDVLRQQASVKDGQLHFADGMSYRLLVLPEFDTMTPRLLRKISELVHAGATVVGPPPRRSPSLADYPRGDAEVQRLARELWGDGGRPAAITERRVGKGRIVWGGEVVASADSKAAPPPEVYPPYDVAKSLLAKMKVAPDFESDVQLRYTHRRDGDADIYFVANPVATPVKARASFRVTGKQPELWDAVTGDIRPLPDFTPEPDRTFVPLEFEAHQSFFIVFRHPTKPAKTPAPNFAKVVPLAEVGGPWQVSFQAGRGAPSPIRLDRLIDWTQHTDAGVRHFSGLATYRTTFETGAEFNNRSSGKRVFLDLGTVKVMAAVRLNGRDLGTAWTEPFRLDATAALKAGTNTLEIRVANLWPNRLIGDAALPPDQRVAWTTWNPFAKDTPLLASGLLGPVRLLAEE